MARLKNIFKLRNLLKAFSVGVALSLVLSYLSPYIHPANWKSLQLFGLAYPIILLIHVILSIVWIFINKKWALTMGILILLGGNLHFRTFTIGSDDDPKGAPQLKVMSYNVHLFDRYNPDLNQARKKKDEIIRYIVKENPDVVCFQEFYHQDKPSNFITKDTLIDLLHAKDYHQRYSQRLTGRQNFGISIFSKFPVVEKGEVVFTGNTLTGNYGIYVDVKTPDGIIRVYNIHLQSIQLKTNDYAVFSDKEKKEPEESSSGLFTVLGKVLNAFPERANQAEILVKHISNSPHPVIVCGDFNDPPMSYTYNQFNRFLTDAYRNTSFGMGKTYAGTLPAGRIDYIFHSPSLGSAKFKIQKKKLSDHYAISCSVFKKRE